MAAIELFLDHPGEPDAELLDIMRSVGSQLGRVFERQQSIEELRRVAADREALVSIVGHELRGPLAAAHAAAGMLADSASFGDEDDMSQLLDRQLGRLRRLVDMFLTAQRLEAGSVTAHPRPVAVSALVDEVITDGDSGQVEATIDDDARVHVDPDHLAQMLWNLLGNATRHGKPPVRVTAERDDNAVTIAVADAGPGVPTELRPHLFDRFARGTASHGTGLGLAIVRGLARANNGDAKYIHGEATGPVFELRLAAP